MWARPGGRHFPVVFHSILDFCPRHPPGSPFFWILSFLVPKWSPNGYHGGGQRTMFCVTLATLGPRWPPDPPRPPTDPPKPLFLTIFDRLFDGFGSSFDLFSLDLGSHFGTKCGQKGQHSALFFYLFWEESVGRVGNPAPLPPTVTEKNGSS